LLGVTAGSPRAALNYEGSYFVPYEAAEICQNFGWLFGRFEDTKISF
jgi:hypothetical protein